MNLTYCPRSLRRAILVLLLPALGALLPGAHADTATHTYDSNGRLSQSSGSGWSATYTYDAAGNVKSIVRTGGAAPVLALQGVVSRKNHGSAGTFDLPLSIGAPVTGAVTVDSRSEASHLIVFQYNLPVTIAGSAVATDKNGAALGTATAVAVNNEVRVTLTGIPDQKRVQVALTGAGGGSATTTVAIGFLIGDVNSSGAVNASDINVVKARSGQSVNGQNFSADLNISGTINVTDINSVKARSGFTLD